MLNFDSPTAPLHLCTLNINIKASGKRFEPLDSPAQLLKPCFRTISGADQERAAIARLEKFLKASEATPIEEPIVTSVSQVQLPVSTPVESTRRPDILRRASSVNDDEFSRKANAITSMKEMTAAPEETCM